MWHLRGTEQVGTREIGVSVASGPGCLDQATSTQVMRCYGEFSIEKIPTLLSGCKCLYLGPSLLGSPNPHCPHLYPAMHLVLPTFRKSTAASPGEGVSQGGLVGQALFGQRHSIGTTCSSRHEALSPKTRTRVGVAHRQN